MQISKKNWFAVSKMTRTWWILTWALKILKHFTLIGSFCTKYITFDLKKSRGVIFHDTEEWWQISRKTDLWFGKWHEKYGKFSPKHLKNFNIGTLIGSFHPKYKIYEFKIYRGVMCHYSEELCNIWRGMDLSLQNWHEKFDEFWPKHSKVSKTCTLMGSLRRNYIMLELKKYRAVMFDGTEDWCKTWRKTDYEIFKMTGVIW